MSTPTSAKKEDVVKFDNPLDAQEAARRQASFDPEAASGDSPKVAAGAETDESWPPAGGEAEFAHELTEDELSDLTFAFQACDIDGGGTIEAEELHAMVAVLGADVTVDRVEDLIKEAKKEFKEWVEQHPEDAELPKEMLVAVNDPGHHDSTKHGGKRHHARVQVKEKREDGTLMKAAKHPIFYPVTVPLNMTQKVLATSLGLAAKGTKAVVHHKRHKKKVKDHAPEPQHMSFAEYVHMIGSGSGLLEKIVPGDWHKSSGQMRGYRNAFDTADVDGDNSLEFEELEMVIIAMDPHLGLTHDDMVYLWDILTKRQKSDPSWNGGSSLNFTQFLHGLADVKRDERARDWIDIDKPNKWELLSLIIDTPVKESEEKAILDKLPGIEKFGISMVKRAEKRMDKEHMREVLTRAGEGKLRELTDEQKERMSSLRWRCIFLSGMVGFLCTIMPAAAENYLCHELQFDGVKDGYWICHQQSDYAESWPDSNWDDPEWGMDERLVNTSFVPPCLKDEPPGLDENADIGSCYKEFDPDMRLCTTLHVNVSSCDAGFFDDDRVTVMRGSGTTADGTPIQGEDEEYNVLDKDFYIGKYDVYGMLRYESNRMEEDGVTPEDFDAAKIAAAGAKVPWGRQTPDAAKEGWARVAFAPYQPIDTSVVTETNLLDLGITQKEICSRCMCQVCSCLNHNRGLINLDAGNIAFLWWFLLVIVIVVNILFEIPGLMYFGMKYCTRVAWALDIRLAPLNADRAFVADSLVRAAFELGNPDQPMLGVDPHAHETGTLEKSILMALYKGKVVISGLALKMVVGKVTEPEFGLWAKPWMGMVTMTIFWDALIAHCIVLQASIRGMGVFTSCEVFNEVMDAHYKDASEISELGKLEIARSIGVAIVKNGSMYPTMELLLRHAIQYLGLRGKKCIAEPGVLDNEEEYLAKLGSDFDGTCEEANEKGETTKDDRECALSIILLAFLLTGSIGRKERQLFKEICETVGGGKTAGYYEDRLTMLCVRFRNFEAITAEDLRLAFDPSPEADGKAEMPHSARAQNFAFRVSEIMTC